MGLYWIRSYNFGDILNPVLYRCITGREPVFSDTSPKTLAIGSVLNCLGPGDKIWGTGGISTGSKVPYYPNTEILAVRGPLTEYLIEQAGYTPSGIYGDPSLLLPRFIKPSQSRTGLVAFLPHYIDSDGPFDLPGGVMLLSVATPPLELIEQITSCEAMITSSLHGLCVAEAYGIPAVWVELSNNVAGSGFKFHDYYAGTGRVGTLEPLDWRETRLWDLAFDRLYRWVPPVIDGRLMDVCPF